LSCPSRSREAGRGPRVAVDIAYRFFTAEERKFIVTGAQRHEQYTSNIVMGASTADLARTLVDANTGALKDRISTLIAAKLIRQLFL